MCCGGGAAGGPARPAAFPDGPKPHSPDDSDRYEAEEEEVNKEMTHSESVCSHHKGAWTQTGKRAPMSPAGPPDCSHLVCFAFLCGSFVSLLVIPCHFVDSFGNLCFLFSVNLWLFCISVELFCVSLWSFGISFG